MNARRAIPVPNKATDMSATKKTSWREKLADAKDLPQVVEITGKQPSRVVGYERRLATLRVAFGTSSPSKRRPAHEPPTGPSPGRAKRSP